MKISDVKVGTVLFADGGFTCLSLNQKCVVAADGDGSLFVECSEGKHGVDGQLDFNTGTDLVGLSSAPWEANAKD